MFQVLFQCASSLELLFVSASQGHWKWPLSCLFFFLGGKTIKYYFRKFHFMHVYNNLVVFLFPPPQDFQKGITGTCVSAGQAMLHQTFWGNSETMRSKMRNAQHFFQQFSCLFVCQQLQVICILYSLIVMCCSSQCPNTDLSHMLWMLQMEVFLFNKQSPFQY